MLKIIKKTRGNKEAYLVLERAGKNLVDLLPGGVMRRAAQQVERFAAGRIEDSARWGKTAQS
jgi:hypothetical protein